MNLLALCLLSFIVGFVIHLAVWRLGPAREQFRALLAIFATPFAVVFISANHAIGTSLTQLLGSAIFYVSLVFFYIANYSAVSAESPMLWLLKQLTDPESSGARLQTLRKSFSRISTFEDRLSNLTTSGLVEKDGTRLKLGAKTSLALNLIIAYRKSILRMPA